MRRLVALVAAVVMIAGAVFVRSRLDRNEVARTVRLVCAEELAVACTQLADRLQTTVEAAGATADRLAAATGDPGLDGWLVPAPWPEIVDARRRVGSLPDLFANQSTVARSPLVLVIWNDRAAPLGGRCRGPVNWRCLGDAVAAGPWTASGGQAAWGRVKPSHASPVTDGVGLLILGHAVSGWFGNADLSTGELDADDAFARWFPALARAVATTGAGSNPLASMLTVGRAGYDAVGTTEAEAGPLLARAAQGSEVTVLYPSPMATADAVLALAGKGSTASSLRRLAAGAEAKRALAGAGWRVRGVPSATGVPTTPALPPTDGLPNAGLLEALRTNWQETAR